MQLRQMPELFLRGSVANQTMKNLLPEQKLEVNRVTEFVINHPSLIPNKSEFIKQLGRTIGGDYREDHKVAELEYQVAIWRGVVYLLYHCSYSYICGNCKSSTYLTQRNKPSPMDQRYPVCPSCRCVKTTDAGGDVVFMSHEAFQNSILALPENAAMPKCESPILPIPGVKKVGNPDLILGDPVQLNKFFSEFIWNYFRQILNENKITYHRKEPKEAYGPADSIAVLEIIGLLTKNKVKYQYCNVTQPENGAYHIYCQVLTTPPEFSPEYMDIVNRHMQFGVKINNSESEFTVPSVAIAPMVSVLVVNPVRVSVNGFQSRV